MKFVIGQNNVVINVVNTPPADPNAPVYQWLVPDAQVVNVGDAFDPKDPQIDAMDVAAFRALFRHENLLRQIIRTLRTNAGLNTNATTNGLPLSAAVPDVTLAEARAAFKSLLP